MHRRSFLAATAIWPAAARAILRVPPQPSAKRHLAILDASMACVDTAPDDATGPTFVFLHGNPTSSYLWRHIIPSVRALGRCVAPDLIGMGDSAKLRPSGPDRYRFVEQRAYLDALLDRLALGNRVFLVLHDWGGMLGFDWARRHADRIAGIAHMETVMDGLDSATAPAGAIQFFRQYRAASGEALILEQNQFVEQVLLGSLRGKLTASDAAEYRRPFLAPGEGRRPMLSWPREIPIDGDPADVAAIIADARAWLAASPVPKLFVNVEPGALLASPARKAICRSWPNTTEVTIAGGHYVQEESPAAIGAALHGWASGLR